MNSLMISTGRRKIGMPSCFALLYFALVLSTAANWSHSHAASALSDDSNVHRKIAQALTDEYSQRQIAAWNDLAIQTLDIIMGRT